jgi:hypothetical protein
MILADWLLGQCWDFTEISLAVLIDWYACKFVYAHQGIFISQYLYSAFAISTTGTHQQLDGAALLDVVLPKSTVLFERLASQREAQVVALSREGYTGC